LSTMAAARQKEMKESMAVVAMTTFGRPGFCAEVDCCVAIFVDISARLVSAPARPATWEFSPFAKELLFAGSSRVARHFRNFWLDSWD